MSSQTIAQVPYNLTDPDSLKRFLSTLVNNLDTVLGYKGVDDKYVTDKDFKTASKSVSELTTQVDDAATGLTAVQEQQEQQGTTLDEQARTLELLGTFLKTKVLDVPYRDMNAAAYNSLQGRFEFSALGSEILNPPEPLTPGATYTVHIDSTKTNNSVWQYVVIYSGSLNVYTRIGVGSWTKLN